MKELKMSDNQRIAQILRKDSIADLVGMLVSPCEGCDTESCPSDCGYYEQEGLHIGPAHARKELQRRKDIIDRALSL